MRRFALVFKNDIKLFSKQVLTLFAILIAIVFIFIAKRYSFERGKSTIYVNIKGDTAIAEFLKIQAQKDSSTILLDSKDKVIKSMSINPFCYGLDIDTDKNKVDIIIKGYESEKVINNIMLMSAFLMNNSQDFSDIDVNYIPSENTIHKQQEKQVIPIFVYIMVSIMPMLMTFLLMFEQKGVMENNIELICNKRIVLASKIVILTVFHMILSLLVALITCTIKFDITTFLVFAFLSCSISSCIGIILSAIYNNIYRALKTILALLIIIVLPIWNLAFGTKRYLLLLDFYYYPYKAIRDIILYKDGDKIDYGLIAYPALVLLGLFISLMMYYEKINRWQNKGL